MSLYFINLLLLLFAVNSQTCENNGTFIAGQNACACPVGFVGKTCDVPAYQLTDTQTKIPVDSNFTYAYFSPEQKVIYKFVLTFCNANPPQILNIQVFAQQQKRNGDIQLQPKDKRELVEIVVGSDDNCKQIYSTILVSMVKKQNGELPKIIFGFKLIGYSALLKDQQIFVKCENIQIPIVNQFPIIILLFAILIFFILASLIYMLRKRWFQGRITKEQQTKKYYILKEQLEPNNFLFICFLCSCKFEKDHDVKKTPCGHLYHSNCLDIWCNDNLICPICRKNLEQQQQHQQELEILQQSLREDKMDIRDPIL